jgi:hypothetical protein
VQNRVRCGFYFSPAGSPSTRKQPIKCSFSPAHHESSWTYLSRHSTSQSHLDPRLDAATAPAVALVPLCSLTLAALASQLVAARLWPLDPDVAAGDVVPLLWTGGARQTAASCGEGVREGHTGTAVVDAPSCSATSGDQRKAGIEVRLRRGGSVLARRRGSTTQPYPDLAARHGPTLTSQRCGPTLAATSYSHRSDFAVTR